jgi:release factor glutamine methyltransferase
VPDPSGRDDTTAAIGLDPTTTRADALVLLRSAFTEAGLDGPDLDARLLLTEALQVDAVEIAARPQVPLGDRAVRLAGLARRRLAREPVGRILGRREFWGLSFELSPETLEPRPDSETVVETALSLAPDRPGGLTVLDLGTGSGCLLVALLHELAEAIGFGVDRSPGALATARRNAWRNGVGDRAAFVASDWTSALQGRFDLIVCNPPYIPSSGIASLAPEVREHDPAPALDGGEDGLAAYRIIFARAADLLASGGSLVVEIGSTQGTAVRRLAYAAGLEVVRVTQDLGGHPRAVGLVPHRETPI